MRYDPARSPSAAVRRRDTRRAAAERYLQGRVRAIRSTASRMPANRRGTYIQQQKVPIPACLIIFGVM